MLLLFFLHILSFTDLFAFQRQVDQIRRFYQRYFSNSVVQVSNLLMHADRYSKEDEQSLMF